jgi:hypothetical protein
MRAAGVDALARAPARAASTPPSRRRAIARRRARAAATSNDGRRASKRGSDEKDDDDDDDDGGGGPPVRAATATAVAAAVAAILASFSSGAPPWDRAMALSAADVGDDAGGGLAGALLARGGNGLNGGGSEAWDRRVAEWAVDAFASLSREDQVIVVEKLEKLILSEDDAISRAGTSSSPRRTRPGDVDLTSREAEAEEANASPAAAERFVRPPARAPLDAPDVRVVDDDEDEAAALARADALDGWGPTTLGTSSSSSFDDAAAAAAAEKKKERNPFVGRGLGDADADYLEPPSGEITTSSETTTIDEEDVEGAIAFATGAVDALRGAVERASRVASTPSDRARFGFLALIALAVGGTAARLVADAEDARESIEHERRRATTTTTTTDGGGGAADADAAAMGAPEGTTTTTFGRGRELPDRARDAPAETSATAAAENPPNPNPPGGAPLWTRREDPERERDAAAEVATTAAAPASGAVLWTRTEGGGGGGARRGGGKDRRRGGRRRLDEDVDDAWEDYERGRGTMDVDGEWRDAERREVGEARGGARGWVDPPPPPPQRRAPLSVAPSLPASIGAVEEENMENVRLSRGGGGGGGGNRSPPPEHE